MTPKDATCSHAVNRTLFGRLGVGPSTNFVTNCRRVDKFWKQPPPITAFDMVACVPRLGGTDRRGVVGAPAHSGDGAYKREGHARSRTNIRVREP